MDKKPKVLFLSKGNASRAQIAEAFVRALAGDQFLPFSAGTESASVNPLAAEIMTEVGIDMSTHQSHDVASLFRENFRYAVVLCDEQHERHPLFPFTQNLLIWPVSDPEVATDAPEPRKQAFRQVRDQIKHNVEDLIEKMNQPEHVFAQAHAKAA